MKSSRGSTGSPTPWRTTSKRRLKPPHRGCECFKAGLLPILQYFPYGPLSQLHEPRLLDTLGIVGGLEEINWQGKFAGQCGPMFWFGRGHRPFPTQDLSSAGPDAASELFLRNTNRVACIAQGETKLTDTGRHVTHFAAICDTRQGTPSLTRDAP